MDGISHLLEQGETYNGWLYLQKGQNLLLVEDPKGYGTCIKYSVNKNTVNNGWWIGTPDKYRATQKTNIQYHVLSSISSCQGWHPPT